MFISKNKDVGKLLNYTCMCSDDKIKALGLSDSNKQLMEKKTDIVLELLLFLDSHFYLQSSFSVLPLCYFIILLFIIDLFTFSAK